MPVLLRVFLNESRNGRNFLCARRCHTSGQGPGNMGRSGPRATQESRGDPMTATTAKYAVEAIGTFFFVLTAALVGPFAAGFMLVAMIFAGGHISGGHFNPAVSIAVF